MQLSRRTLARVMEHLDTIGATFEGGARRDSERTKTQYWEGEATSKHWSRILFEHEIPDWVIAHAERHYHFDWDRIVRDLATGRFFATEYGSIIPPSEEFRPDHYEALGHAILGRVAAIILVGQ